MSLPVSVLPLVAVAQTVARQRVRAAGVPSLNGQEIPRKAVSRFDRLPYATGELLPCSEELEEWAPSSVLDQLARQSDFVAGVQQWVGDGAHHGMRCDIKIQSAAADTRTVSWHRHPAMPEQLGLPARVVHTLWTRRFNWLRQAYHHTDVHPSEELPLRMFLMLELSLIHISEPTRLLSISYAVFCLKKKKKKKTRKKK
eukprot:TRINITY_DN1605_c0_g1_i11.p1 TRINITY_DN1605_c0_g1~~TRINITY_DN1605_c0_g1_i11.p1  ORF type:complete len:199 (-),score=52.46 TRINITY_DN1605_c0_g1_i11:105-701(-)